MIYIFFSSSPYSMIRTISKFSNRSLKKYVKKLCIRVDLPFYNIILF